MFSFWPLMKVKYLDFAGVNDVKVISFVALLNNDLSGNGRYGKHGIEDVWSLVFVQMWKKDVFGNGLWQWGHGLVVFWDHLKKIRSLRKKIVKMKVFLVPFWHKWPHLLQWLVRLIWHLVFELRSVKDLAWATRHLRHLGHPDSWDERPWFLFQNPRKGDKKHFSTQG